MSERVYISHAELSGYKTVSDVKVDFVPGLNIIIGKNGTGKTNFLTFLYKSLLRDYSGLQNFETSLSLNNESGTCVINTRKKQTLVDSKREDFTDTVINAPPEIQVVFKNKGNEIENVSNDNIDILKGLREKGFAPMPIMISHGIKNANDNKVIDSPYSFSIQYNKASGSSDFLLEYTNNENSFFFRSFSGTVFFYLVETLPDYFNDQPDSIKAFDFDEKEIRKNIDEIFGVITEILNNTISEYLPIEKVRLSESYIVYNDINASALKVENVYFEFLMQGNWLPFSSLSDGTKRIFSIYVDIISPRFFDIPSTISNKIILLEEPELGIHPHQLQLLMNLIKSVSSSVQVIITTHSPLVLDILSPSELDSLLISNITKENGTQLMKLNDGQLSAAKFYLENESYLSDYWRYSDLNL